MSKKPLSFLTGILTAVLRDVNLSLPCVLFLLSLVLMFSCGKDSKSPTGEDTYTISGTITGVDDVTMTLSGGASATWTVKKSGESYSFTMATGGTYTVTPSKSGYAFTPSDKTIKNLSANLTQNFDAKLASYTLSGTVTGADSVTVTLSGGSSATWMVNKSGGTYYFNVAAFNTYTITPTKKEYVFTPQNTKVENLVADHVQNFDATPLFTISGKITGANGVTVNLSGDASSTQTVNSGGTYSFIVPKGGTYIITPSKQGYSLTPLNTKYENLADNQTQNFEANNLVPETPVVTDPGLIASYDSLYMLFWKADRAKSYMIQEALNASFTNPVSVTVDSTSKSFHHIVLVPTTYYYRVMGFNGEYKSEEWSNTVDMIVYPLIPNAPKDVQGTEIHATSLTLNWKDLSDNEQGFKIEKKDNGGVYTEIADVGANTTVYSVKALLPAVSYNFRIRAYNITGNSDYTSEISILTKRTFTISGVISGASGVTVTLSGDKSETQTVNADGGTYSFSVDENGSYTVIPAKIGYVFAPVSQSITNVTANKDQDFTASKQTLTISGKVTGADGVTVTLSGDASNSLTVNNGSNYSFSVLSEGTYIVTPSKSGCYFTPPSKIFTIITSNQNQDFNFNPYSSSIKTVSITAGNFSMGQIGIAEPVHKVTLSAFEMSVYEITQGQYKLVMGSNLSYYTGDDNRPVEQVKWNDAIKYCNALSVKAGFQPCYDEKTGDCDFSKNGFRLPTESEWEYACRAGSMTTYNLGNAESDLARAGWYMGNSAETHPVGQKSPNDWGLYDMHGNVAEWCNDWLGEYTSDNQINPVGASTGTQRMCRGGSYDPGAGDCRSVARGRLFPELTNVYIGFRVVRRP
jgi:formylglycine-generating enzyme required for sulfatase activity